MKFARTWWGEQWVKALDKISRDVSRLPRGRSYARKGAVLDIKVHTGEIEARVQGSRVSPYKVKIKLEEFNSKEKTIVKNNIEDELSYASRLKMGELPEELLEDLEVSGVELLPSSWEDFKASCSCPDWADPCKHLAAVIYKLAGEIDKDPFLLFSLRGLDKKELMEAAGLYHEDKPEQKDIEAETPRSSLLDGAVSLDEVVAGLEREEVEEDSRTKTAAETATEAETAIETESETGPEPEPGPKSDSEPEAGTRTGTQKEKSQKTSEELPDLSEIAENDIIEEIFSFLSPSPLFYTGKGDFKQELKKVYKKVKRQAATLGSDVFLDQEESEKKEALLSKAHLIFPARLKNNLLGESYFFVSDDIPSELKQHAKKTNMQVPSTTNPPKAKTKGYKINAPVMLDYLFELSLNDLWKFNRTGKFLALAGAFSQAMAQGGRYIPEVKHVNGSFLILYSPFFRNSRAAEKILFKLASLMPKGFVFYPEKNLTLTGYEGVKLFLSFLQTRLVQRFAEANFVDKVGKAFFKGELYTPDTFEEGSTARVISRWLDELNTEPKRVLPVLKIESEAEIETEFYLNVMVENRDKTSSDLVELKDVYNTPANEKLFSLPVGIVKDEITRQLLILGERISPVAEMLKTKGEKLVKIDSKELLELIDEGEKICKFLNVRMMFPKELKNLIKPKAALKSESDAGEGASTLSLEELTKFSYQVALGDMTLDKEEFKKLVRTKEKIVRFKDRYVFLDPAEVKKIMEKLESPPPEPSVQEVVKASVTGSYDGVEFYPDKNLNSLIQEITSTKKLELPKGFSGELRPYQQEGFGWLYRVTEKGLGCCLADDMGLGKTVQVIALVGKLKEENNLQNPALIVCPTTLLGNWEKEIAKFLPSLRVGLYHGNKRRLDTRGKDVILTTYALARKEVERFKRKTWGLMVIDEAQNIKNPSSQQTRAIKSIPANRKTALTGTPVENRLSELWSIFDFINKGYLGSKENFGKSFSIPIERYRDKSRIELFHKITSPFIMRRSKTDENISKDLPEKLEKDEYCQLKPEQAAFYQQVIDNLMRQIEGSDEIERKGLVFKLMTSLKQICNHPLQYTGDYDKEEPTPYDSGKAEKTIQLVENITAMGEKALIFTQYKQAGELIARMLKNELAIMPLFFHGGLNRKKREEILTKFKNGSDDDYEVMIISLKAGGTGLNLTEAAYVIHYDLWWNPAVENQATDRTHRIGQTNQVQVYRLITQGTFEEKINDMLVNKKELFDLVVSGSPKDMDITELSNEELYQLVSLQK